MGDGREDVFAGAPEQHQPTSGFFIERTIMKTYPPGHFHEQNKKVEAHIAKQTTMKAGVKAFVDAAVKAGIALVDDGASPKQMKASLSAISANFEKTWALIEQNVT